jgi:hypothetical protein
MDARSEAHDRRQNSPRTKDAKRSSSRVSPAGLGLQVFVELAFRGGEDVRSGYVGERRGLVRSYRHGRPHGKRGRILPALGANRRLVRQCLGSDTPSCGLFSPRRGRSGAGACGAAA